MKRTFASFVFLTLLGVATASITVGCKPPAAVKRPSTTTTSPAPGPQPSAEQKKIAADIGEAENEADGPAIPKPEVKPADKPEVKPSDKPLESDPAQKPEDKAGNAKPGDQVSRAEFKPAIDKKANAPVKAGDWNQWGGTSYRNNTPIAKDVPTDWSPGSFDRKTGEWKKDGENIKWVAAVGSQTYGNPVIASGKVLVGTNNNRGYVQRYPHDVDLGVLACFNEKDGKFLWQHSSEKLPTGRVHDWPQQGICAASYVEGDRAWITTSRGEIICVDVEGFHDGEDDGEQNLPAKMFEMMKNEDAAMDKVAPAIEALGTGKLPADVREQFANSGMELPENQAVEAKEAGKKWTIKAKVGDADRELFIVAQGPKLIGYKVLSPADTDESDVIWTFDMMKELGSSQHNMCSTSVTAYGDILFCNTGNGVDESHINIPAPTAPSFFALDKNTKEVLWTDNSPGENIIHGQWSSPAVAKLGGVDQVIYGGGDGWLYSFKADKGKDGKPELLWKFDLNPKDAKWVLGGRGTRNEPIGTPVIYDGLVYIAVGQDPEHGEGIGHLYCIDPSKRGDVSEVLAVKRSNPKEIVPPRRLVGVVAEEGEVAIPNPNNACVWHFSEQGKKFEEQMHRTIGTVAIKDDLLFIADFSGLFHCFDAKTGEVNWVHDMLAASWGSPLIADGKVYMGDEDGDIVIFNLSKKKHQPIAEINMGNSVYSTPVFANGVLYIANKTHVFAIQNADAAEVASTNASADTDSESK
jgi:outer membrane protein assembly factor BamB